MYDIFTSILGIIKHKPISTDNNIFKLHYKATMFILVTFSLLITQKQYFGDPIDCITTEHISVIDTYCWIQSTFTVANLDLIKGISTGVGSPVADGKPLEIRYHTYYQWVTLILYLQALMFYIPRYIWKSLEGGKLKTIIDGMQLPILDEEDVTKRKKFIIQYLKNNFHKNNSYAYKFFVCEILNFVNVVGQIFLTDRFVGYEFTTYGTKIFGETQAPFASRHDTLEHVFPKVTKCTYLPFGKTGSRNIIDALCVLPLNVFNEKIYIFLWFWFIIIAVISGLGLLYRCATFYEPIRSVVLRSKARFANPDELKVIEKKCDMGDWFFIYQMAKNVDENFFKGFVSDFAKELRND